MNKENDGVWRTIRGRRVFIRKGESLDSAMKRSGKFNNSKNNTDKEKKEYELYKQAKENPDSIDPMTENSTDWEELDRKYSNRYDYDLEKADARKEKIASNNGNKSNISKNQEAKNYMEEQFKRFDNGDISVAELEKAKIDSGLSKKEIDEARNYTNERVQENYPRITENKSGNTTSQPVPSKKEKSIPESMLKNSKELSDIAKRTGGTSLTSEAGRRWDKLYKEDKNNIAYDLGDNYSARLGYAGDISIQSSHPYNETNYSWASANIENGKVKNWKVTIPGSGSEIVNNADEALKTMKMADEWIDSGKKVKDFEGITNTHTPKTTYEQFKKQKQSNVSNTGSGNAFADSMQKMSQSELLKEARKYGINTSGKSKEQLISALLSMFNS